MCKLLAPGFCLLLLSPLSAAEPGWRFETNDDGVRVSDGERPVFAYQRKAKSWNGRFERAHYVHPLYDLDGRELTEDFPADHRHHRGIFWGWHQVTVGERKAGDSWALEKFSWDVRDVRTTHNDQAAELRATVHWQSPLLQDDAGKPIPFVREEAIVRAERERDQARIIDFEIRLQAMEKEVRIGGSEDEKGYGGFSPRIRLPKGLRFLGRSGEVAPQITAVDAGPWLDLTARFGEGPEESGVAVLCHPDVPGFPPRWILRNVGSMQNVAYPGREPIVLPTDKPLVLRYRLVVHRGAGEPAKIEAWHQAFAK